MGDEVNVSMSLSFEQIELKSLILAQIERWRHALHMQVERQRGGNPGGERRTGEEYIGTCPRVGDNAAKAALIPHILRGGKWGTARPHAHGAADVGLASWWGKGLPRRRSVAGLRG